MEIKVYSPNEMAKEFKKNNKEASKQLKKNTKSAKGFMKKFGRI